MSNISRGTLSRALTLLLLCLSVVSFAGAAQAAVHYVPDNFASIQAAINAAAAGDTIMVRAGTYYEHLYINGKTLYIRSLEGPYNTIIDGSHTGTVVIFSNQSKYGSLEGFTIRNGSGGGINIYYYSNPLIRNCIIENNESGNGGGIYASWVATATIEDTIIRNNHATYYGGGVYAYLGGPRLTRTLITGNTAGYGGGGLASNGYCSQFTLFDSIVTDNYAPRGGAAYMTGSSACTVNSWIHNSLLAFNSADEGGAIYNQGNAWFRLVSSTVAWNDAEVGGSIYSPNTTGGIYGSYNNIIWGNSTLPDIAYVYSITTSDVEGGLPGTGNFDADPLFVDGANGDFHLSPGSPAIDAGQNSGEYGLPAYDLDGTPRPQGAAYDLGAYEAPACQDAPTVQITSVSPDAIWPANNKAVEVTVSGYIAMEPGCTLESASFALDDEYGVYSDSGELVVAGDGSFELVATVEASRLGSDRDGRSYDVTITATNGGGTTDATASATVLHDMR